MASRQVRILAVLVLTAGLATGAILGVLHSASRAKPVAPRRAAGAVGPLHFTPATPPAKALTHTEAIAAARRVGYSLAPPAVKVRATFGIATDSEYYLERKNGRRHYYVKNRPVWIVTFTGEGIVPDPGPAGHRPSRNKEMNVVIDGFSGQELEDYSYR